MANYDQFISRQDATGKSDLSPGGVVPEDVFNEIFKRAPEKSAILSMIGDNIKTLKRGQTRIPVQSTKPNAYFVNGDIGLKETTDMRWRDVFLNVEEIAVIVPVPDAVFSDADYNLWGEIMPELVEAVGVRFDEAVLFGGAPSGVWPTPLMTQIVNAGNAVPESHGDDLYDALLGEGGVLSKLELDGFMATGHIAVTNMRGKMRGLRDADGNPIFRSGLQDSPTRYELDGESLFFSRNGAIDPSKALLISGDWSEMVVGIRQDIDWMVADQGVITDGSGAVTYNLFQQDAKALRLVFRVAWALPNPVNRIQPDNTFRLPFASLVPAGSTYSGA